MPVEIRRGRDGKIRPIWYGAYTDSTGKRKVIALTEPLPVDIYPGSLKNVGCPQWEASRARAEKELQVFQQEARLKGRAEALTEKLLASKTGQAITYVKVDELAKKWRVVGRSGTKPTENHLAACDAVFQRFRNDVSCTYLHEVTNEDIQKHIANLYNSYSDRTVQGSVQLLRSAFRRFLPHGVVNPFENQITSRSNKKGSGTISRQPFELEELHKLFEIAKADEFMHPLIVTAACTGMRRGDVCNLKWTDVDLLNGALSVKTSKTGAGVTIPIFKPLQEVLEQAFATCKKNAVYVFPEAAKMHASNPDGLTWRFKKLVVEAIEALSEDIIDVTDEIPEEPKKVSLADVLSDVLQAVKKDTKGKRRNRIIQHLNLYAEGNSIRDIEKITGKARSTISSDLHLAQKLANVEFMRTTPTGRIKEQIAELTQIRPLGRARSASIRDWHSLRTSFVTLALSSGVPIEICQMITGHKTVEVVLKHYFKPQAGQLRKVLEDKLPTLLTGMSHIKLLEGKTHET